ncbi:Hypothetical protein I596_1105 [Dokdonella koreensis DS-123]|uniref:Uncharacterized protein n=1 Tax=Dokdonella koreensis DS-123 TaxID=1300342 RepID=A0A160DSA9_9GAMM|nr:Hypothetical protein I596_1105 [Dokdonella koreensis DS-123]
MTARRAGEFRLRGPAAQSSRGPIGTGKAWTFRDAQGKLPETRPRPRFD